MKTKNAVYAAVGAPIVAAKAVNARLEKLRAELENRSDDVTRRAKELLEEFATEGEQAVEKLSDRKVVDEITAKVDFDQAREQVGKLRDQLEDMLTTWRASFRPEGAAENGASENGATEKAADADTATKPAAKKPAAKKAGTAKATTQKAATAKKSAAKKPAAKKPAETKASSTESKAS
ncbi:MAG TPA: hypothetical protein VK070_04745 [Acidimicrobiia bacterium]|jgi:hypothetical protein|nr:hypothetical protein [Acidimicrobiia bacterium]